MVTKRSFDLESKLPRLADEWRLAACIVVLAVVQQALGHLNCDDSWFLTFAEKYREGFIPYVNITDPNPPAAFLAYLPAVLIARSLAVAPEMILVILTFLGAGAAIFLSGTILCRAGLLKVFLANLVLLGSLFFVSRFGGREPRTLALAAASAGFLLTFLIQGNGWMNHGYPGMALALLASASFLSAHAEGAPNETGRAGRSRRWFKLYVFVPGLCPAPFLFGTIIDFSKREEYPGLTNAVRQVAPPHPKIIALSELLDVGHPLVRRLDGTRVGRQNCLWVSWRVRYLIGQGRVTPADKDRLLAHMRKDEEMFAEDVSLGKPDVLLVESPRLETWARAQPALGGIFQFYHRVGKNGQISIWLRDQNESAR
jgi:hypothetical protein